jgi:hypothetical protein
MLNLLKKALLRRRPCRMALLPALSLWLMAAALPAAAANCDFHPAPPAAGRAGLPNIVVVERFDSATFDALDDDAKLTQQDLDQTKFQLLTVNGTGEVTDAGNHIAIAAFTDSCKLAPGRPAAYSVGDLRNQILAAEDRGAATFCSQNCAAGDWRKAGQATVVLAVGRGDAKDWLCDRFLVSLGCGTVSFFYRETSWFVVHGLVHPIFDARAQTTLQPVEIFPGSVLATYRMGGEPVTAPPPGSPLWTSQIIQVPVDDPDGINHLYVYADRFMGCATQINRSEDYQPFDRANSRRWRCRFIPQDVADHLRNDNW